MLINHKIQVNTSHLNQTAICIIDPRFKKNVTKF